MHAMLSAIEPPPTLRDWLAVLRRHLRLAVGVAAAVIGVSIYLASTAQSVYRATAVVRLVDARRALAGDLIDATANGDIALSLPTRPVAGRGAAESGHPGGRRERDAELRIGRGLFPMPWCVTSARPEVRLDSVQLSFGQDRDRRGETPPREAEYGTPLEVRGVTFTIAEQPPRERGTVYVVPRDWVSGGLAKQLQVKPRENTDVIDVAFLATEPERAQEVANRIVQVFQAGNARAAHRRPGDAASLSRRSSGSATRSWPRRGRR